MGEGPDTDAPAGVLDAADEAASALGRAVAQLPGGDARPGQEAMCRAVAEAIESDGHVLVQAGTGTGKGLAYLVPAILSGRRTVVVTATLALQEQLVGKDLPFLAEHLGRPFRFTLLKGRSNYLCLARKAEMEERLDADTTLLAELDEWIARTGTGDRADLPRALPDTTWERLSVDSSECPGRLRCDLGEACFAEQARARAGEADVVVVNAALYARHLATGGNVLPEHDVVVVDEAHTLEDFAAGAFGVELGPGRVHHLAGVVGSLLTSGDPPGAAADDPAGRLHGLADGLESALASCPDDRTLDVDEAGLRTPLVALREHLAAVQRAVSAITTGDAVASRKKEQATRSVDAARTDIARLLAARPGDDAVWVERGRRTPTLRLAAVDVATPLAAALFAEHPTVLTSATLAVGGNFAPVARTLGLDDFDALDVGSPFDYPRQAILYLAGHLPDPRRPQFEEAWLAESVDLVRAAGGRTLGLCTSLRAAEALRARLREALDVRVLAPDDLPRGRLMEEFARDETSCLVGSLGLWQGLDVPGPAVSLVIVDKIPFARPTDPLATARRAHAEAQGRSAFEAVDLPRAAMLLAQGAGRLVRHGSDRGAVAVLDPRLVTKGYGRVLVASLPPMYRVTDPARVRAALERLRDARPAAAPAP